MKHLDEFLADIEPHPEGVRPRQLIALATRPVDRARQAARQRGLLAHH